MGLLDAIQAATKAAFAPIEDITVSVNYLSMADQVDSYVPASGIIHSTATTYSGINMLMTDISSEEMTTIRDRYRDNDANLNLSTTKKMLVPALDLTPTPRVGDKLTISSVNWDIFDVETDPATALWTLFVRKP